MPIPRAAPASTQASLSLTYNPQVVSLTPADITLGNIPQQGSGWQLSAVVDAATGQIGILLVGAMPISATQAGSLVNLAFHRLALGDTPAAKPPAATVQLVASATPNGLRFDTSLADSEGGLILSQGVDQFYLPNDLSLVARPDDNVASSLLVSRLLVSASIAGKPLDALTPAATITANENGTEVIEETEVASLSVLSNGAVTETSHGMPANLAVGGLLAFQPNAGLASSVQPIGQLVQVSAATTGLPIPNGVVPQPMADRWFLAMARGTDTAGNANGWDMLAYSLNQDWLASSGST